MVTTCDCSVELSHLAQTCFYRLHNAVSDTGLPLHSCTFPIQPLWEPLRSSLPLLCCLELLNHSCIALQILCLSSLNRNVPSMEHLDHRRPPMRSCVCKVLNKCIKVILTSYSWLKILHCLCKRVLQVGFLKDLYHKEIKDKFM